MTAFKNIIGSRLLKLYILAVVGALVAPLVAVFVSPAKHGQHIGIMTPSASSASPSSTFGFPINNF